MLKSRAAKRLCAENTFQQPCEHPSCAYKPCSNTVMRCDTFQTPYGRTSCAYKPCSKTGMRCNSFQTPYERPELCLEAVQQNGWALQYVPDDLRTYELCLQAVQQDGLCAAVRSRGVVYRKNCENGDGTACADTCTRGSYMAFRDLSESFRSEACEYVEEVAAAIFICHGNLIRKSLRERLAQGETAYG